jgi:hypothetical protein
MANTPRSRGVIMNVINNFLNSFKVGKGVVA